MAVAAAALIALSFATSASAQRGPRAIDGEPVISVYEVRTAPAIERVAAVGSGKARHQVTLTTRVAGVIEEILFKGGDKVEAGQPLIRLNAEQEAIAVESAEAQRQQAAEAVERLMQIKASVSRVQIADAETALKVADAALRRARDEENRMTIRAPFSGIIGLTDLEVGDYLAVGTPVAALDDRTTIVIEFTVPEAAAPSIKIGMPVRASLAARPGEIHNGEVRAVGTRIDPVTRTLAVRGEVPNPDQALIPGSTFSVSVQLTGEESPVVPGLAIQWDRAGAYVWRVTDENTVERVNAAIVARNGDRVFIDAPLKAGDRIVHEGGGFLREKQQVRLVGS